MQLEQNNALVLRTQLGYDGPIRLAVAAVKEENHG